MSSQDVKELVVTEVDEEFVESMDEFRELPEFFVEDRTMDNLLEVCSDSPVLFADLMLGVRLYSWQVDFSRRVVRAFEDDYWTKEFCAICSRQIGKSLDVAVLSLWAALFNKRPHGIQQNTYVGIVSATDQQAKDLMTEIKRLIRGGDVFMKEKYGRGSPETGDGFFSNLLSSEEANNKSTISFRAYDESMGALLEGSRTGSSIVSYPPTPVVLGRTFSLLIIDEAGFSEKITDQFFYDYVYPTGNAADAVRIYTSTPWQPSGFFYRKVDPDGVYGERKADVLMYDVDALSLEPGEQAARQRRSNKRIIEELLDDGKVSEVKRAYYCEFVKGEKNFFDPDDVDDMFRDYESFDEFSEPCDLGIDFGGSVNSHTVVTVSALNEDSGEIARLYSRRYPVDQDESLLDDVARLLRKFNVQRIVVDDCERGKERIKEMRNIRGWNVTSMVFRRDKVWKYTAFKSKLHRGLIISFDDVELKKEMKALENTDGRRQSTIGAPRNYKDDLVDSFVISCYHFLEQNVAPTGFLDIDNYEF